MKKGDIILIISVLAIAVSVSLFFLFGKSRDTVVVSQNNTVVFTGSIKENNTVNLETNTIIIENGKVFVENATCKNQICVKHKPISKKSETIVCLPNKVLVEIK